jgi:hypothetical protein
MSPSAIATEVGMMIGVLLSSQNAGEFLGIGTTEHRLPGGDTHVTSRVWKCYAILRSPTWLLVAILAVTVGFV